MTNPLMKFPLSKLLQMHNENNNHPSKQKCSAHLYIMRGNQLIQCITRHKQKSITLKTQIAKIIMQCQPLTYDAWIWDGYSRDMDFTHKKKEKRTDFTWKWYPIQYEMIWYLAYLSILLYIAVDTNNLKHNAAYWDWLHEGKDQLKKGKLQKNAPWFID